MCLSVFVTGSWFINYFLKIYPLVDLVDLQRIDSTSVHMPFVSFELPHLALASVWNRESF
jgi:hypothetical protein